MLFPGGEAVGGEGTLNSGEKQSCIQHYDKVKDYNDECFCLSHRCYAYALECHPALFESDA